VKRPEQSPVEASETTLQAASLRTGRQTAVPSDRDSRLGWARRNRSVLGVYVALILLVVLISIGSPYFFTLSNLRILLIIASTLALICAGLTIVMIAGEIDLSIGAMQAFAGTIAALIIHSTDIPWPIGALVALLVGTSMGLISGLITTFAGLPSFITTLAMLGIVQGVAYIITDGQPISGMPEDYSFLANGSIGPVPVVLVIVFAVYASLHFMLHRTTLGLHIFAVGGNRAAAAAVGISVRRTVIIVLTMSAAIASLAGIIITSRLGAASGQYGASDLLPAVAAVVIGGVALTGGIGSLVGVFGGVLIIVTIDNGLILLGVSQFWKQVAVGLIMLLVVLVDQRTRLLARAKIPT
jgi:ribose/xylose/arabinose/galactoside ABC-type transport system permease subunit